MKIAVHPEDVRILELELEHSSASVDPLFMPFKGYERTVQIERQHAYNLVSLFKMNSEQRIPTYVEITNDYGTPGLS